MAKAKNLNTDPTFRDEFPTEEVETVNGAFPDEVLGERPMSPDTHVESIESIPGDKNFDRLVHDDQGNVREIFTREGVGEVTRADAENVLDRLKEGGIYQIVGRGSEEERVYDVYKRGTLLIAGASLKDLETLL